MEKDYEGAKQGGQTTTDALTVRRPAPEGRSAGSHQEVSGLSVKLPHRQVRVWSCREIIEEARGFLRLGGSDARREIVKTVLALDRML